MAVPEDDVSRPVSFDFGASSALNTDGRITLSLNTMLRDFDRVYVTAVAQRNGSSPNLRFTVKSGSWRTLEGGVAGPVGQNYPPSALYVLCAASAASEVTTYAVPLVWLHQPRGHHQNFVQTLEVEVRDWRGAAVTYDSLHLQLVATKQNRNALAFGTDNRIISGAEGPRGRRDNV